MFRITVGIVLILVGLGFAAFALLSSLVFMIHAVILCGLGVAILLNKTEDTIEEINEPANNKNL